MVLAAGKGLRLRPLTDKTPKPLVFAGGKPLIAYALDALDASGVRDIVVNAHHLADSVATYVSEYGRKCRNVRLHLSHEDVLLETGGGVVRALPWLGLEPFFVLNSDVIVRDGATPALARLAQAFEPARMDALLLVQPVERAIGYDGKGDYDRAADGRLTSRGDAPRAAFVFTGMQLLAPRLFDGAPSGAFSLKLLYDRAEAAGRLYGLVHDGAWLHIGTPDGLALAERTLRAAG
jgi:MurNAc alpha-1-phosphate uridylyltransferase